jgi:isochorismate hydrolase
MAAIQDHRLSPDESALIIVDVQDKLMAAMEEGIRSQVVSRIRALIEAAKRLDFPVIATEQYPKGLGPTVDEIAESLPDFSPMEKLTFSCCGADGFLPQLRELGRTKVILTGSETHVCCFQTAMDLMENGFIVHPVADALCSRAKLNWKIGLGSMKRAGALPTTTEQVLFDLLRTAGTEDFKNLSRLIR